VCGGCTLQNGKKSQENGCTVGGKKIVEKGSSVEKDLGHACLGSKRGKGKMPRQAGADKEDPQGPQPSETAAGDTKRKKKKN